MGKKKKNHATLEKPFRLRKSILSFFNVKKTLHGIFNFLNEHSDTLPQYWINTIFSSTSSSFLLLHCYLRYHNFESYLTKFCILLIRRTVLDIGCFEEWYLLFQTCSMNFMNHPWWYNWSFVSEPPVLIHRPVFPYSSPVSVGFIYHSNDSSVSVRLINISKNCTDILFSLSIVNLCEEWMLLTTLSLSFAFRIVVGAISQ